MLAVAATVKHFLDKYRVAYRVLNHERTQSLFEAAKLLELDLGAVLKTVLLKDKFGILLAILPLYYQIDFNALSQHMERSFEIVQSNDVDKFFKDCEPGVHTPFGEIYGIPLILDKMIKELETVYIEVGSQTALIQLSLHDFEYLTRGAPCFNFAIREPVSV